MKTKNLGLLVILGAILIFGGCACTGYNSLVGHDENVKKASGDLQADYQRRSNIINNLVETVKGAANFEKTTLTNVVEARAKATSININADNLTTEQLAEFQKAQSTLTSGLKSVLATVEAYPDLKSNANFLALQTDLTGTENRIKNSVRDYNQAVQDFNTKARSFPMNILAGLFNKFKPKIPFAAEPGSDKVPEVKF